MLFLMNENDFNNVFYSKNALRILKQTGKIGDRTRDKGRLAQPAGKRLSKSGKVYWETRKNRTDALNSTL